MILGPCRGMERPEPRAVTQADYANKIDELDRLLNDPDVRLEPARVWALLAEVKQVAQRATPPDAPR